jgi:hypothetical protein
MSPRTTLWEPLEYRIREIPVCEELCTLTSMNATSSVIHSNSSWAKEMISFPPPPSFLAYFPSLTKENSLIGSPGRLLEQLGQFSRKMVWVSSPTSHFLLIKLKLSLCSTNKAHRHEGVWGSRCIDPHFLDLGTSCKGVVSFTPRPLYPRGKSPPVSIG